MEKLSCKRGKGKMLSHGKEKMSYFQRKDDIIKFCREMSGRKTDKGQGIDEWVAREQWLRVRVSARVCRPAAELLQLL